ncbi:SIMPL domain-containing protein [Pelomonas sp. CA6]|uniref:SIMPL domain-containing protein n=1 Tax=Pelomonas sp. CA6 TaxID=2907999 RepID=UPI001F4A7823|nr:SIMPL domain-containing protein [Pelomonas sp. CA6]MCH7342469.1 SIMPL domain-containing protein [Pelomonas sp. CA6]
MSRKALVLAITALSASLGALSAQAAPGDGPHRDVITLSATGSAEVSRDTIQLVFSTTKEGSDAGQVQAQLKQALDAALTEARKIAKPGGQVEVQTGNFSLYPRYAQQAKNAGPQITGWQGSAELMVEGKDITAISQLSGRIASMSIARVGYGLSREAREKLESEVTAQAIERFKLKAADYARQFGYKNWQLGEVSVNADQAVPPMPMMAAPRFKAAMAGADESLPVEAGKATVSATVSGSVLLSK